MIIFPSALHNQRSNAIVKGRKWVEYFVLDCARYLEKFDGPSVMNFEVNIAIHFSWVFKSGGQGYEIIDE